ncbi:MAG: thermostable hemolysin [Gammaproteobacteria bacterium]|nr:thermostable hemolysin [Gammaproteobacteria bacterium]
MNLENGTLVPISRFPNRAELLGSPRRQLIDSEHPRRRQVEQFIAQRYLEAHGARVSGFMPELIALFDDDDEILAAVGIRGASSDSLFLEYYLDAPVEQAILDNADRPLALPHREQIVEIGNLASTNRNASRELFTLLADLLHARNFEWAVFTGCTSLHRMFKILGIETLYLGRALQSQLPADQQTWGSYYEDSPRVVAGKVSGGCNAFENIPGLPAPRAVS